MSEKAAKAIRRAAKKAVKDARVQISQEEVWAGNSLNNAIQNAKMELTRCIAARDSFMALLEIKYQAKFDFNTGTLTAIEKPKVDEPKEPPKKKEGG